MIWAAVASAEPPQVGSVPVGQVATGVVSSSSATFHIVVPPKEAWTWNVGMPGVREYGWVVEVATPEGRYRVGVQVWHEEGGVLQQGTLSALVQSGEAGVWRADNEEGPLLKEMPVSAHVQGGEIVIEVTDPATLQALFIARPATFRVVTHRGHGPRPEQRFSSEKAQIVTLVYRD